MVTHRDRQDRHTTITIQISPNTYLYHKSKPEIFGFTYILNQDNSLIQINFNILSIDNICIKYKTCIFKHIAVAFIASIIQSQSHISQGMPCLHVCKLVILFQLSAMCMHIRIYMALSRYGPKKLGIESSQLALSQILCTQLGSSTKQGSTGGRDHLDPII